MTPEPQIEMQVTANKDGNKQVILQFNANRHKANLFSHPTIINVSIDVRKSKPECYAYSYDDFIKHLPLIYKINPSYYNSSLHTLYKLAYLLSSSKRDSNSSIPTSPEMT